ncbi:putative Hsp70 nucleotide exchange factor [Myriangium duriaei CBS 260.36]|uniref:Hsp70 nucleotide exchange factor n=1 Tax=Myriangium duriaei CBS 260.36 TaxID=1168546 RepID=A0A9P4J8Z1_9PEZI|nr:putative Hsp70 nucleotide exchange factor [Myriangium duriaei CBS 260.36]
MTDPGFNSLLKWSIENSEEAHEAGNAPPAQDAGRGLDQEALKRLMGGPSDADLMVEAMTVIHHPEATLEDKLVAWDNFEQLIENLDNANNMSNLNLWQPLVQKFQDLEPEVRTMACWCAGTAVQNNVNSQVKLLAVGAISALVDLAVNDSAKSVRRKAVMALSSEVRNYQPALDEALKHLPSQFKTSDKVDATDMDAVDQIIQSLRDHAAKAS